MNKEKTEGIYKMAERVLDDDLGQVSGGTANMEDEILMAETNLKKEKKILENKLAELKQLRGMVSSIDIQEQEKEIRERLKIIKKSMAEYNDSFGEGELA